MPGNSIVTPLHLGIAFAVLVQLCVLAGRTQRRESGASWGRLWLASLLLSSLVFLPCVPALLFGEALDFSWGSSASVVSADELEATGQPAPEGASLIEEGGRRYYLVPFDGDYRATFGSGYTGVFRPVNLLVLLFALIPLLRNGIGMLRPLRKHLKELDELPRVEDPDVLARVDAITERMGIADPRVYRLISVSGHAEVQAVTGGAVGATIIATDGVLDQLDDDEGAAILAHEVAHIARRSIWRMMIGIALCQTAVVLASAWIFPSVAIALGLAAAWTLFKLISQVEEHGSDRLAARAVGFASMARALDKTHAANRLPCGPAWTRLVHATATHPSAAMRAAHLRTHAPLEDRDTIAVDADEVAAQRRTNRVVLTIAAALFAAGVWGGIDARVQWYGVGCLALIVVSPPLVGLLAVYRRLLDLRRLGYLPLPWAFCARVLIYATSIYFVFTGLGEPWCWPTWIAIATFVTTFWLARRRVRRWANITKAVRTLDLDGATRLVDELPRRERTRPNTQLLRAQLLLAGRRDDEARAELEALIERRPKFWPAHLMLSLMTSWTDPERGLEIADAVDRAVPNNPYPLSNRAGSLSRMGRFEEAEAVVERILTLAPNDGVFLTLAAGVASRADDHARTAARIEVAERHDPASTALLVVKARYSVRTADREVAEEVLRVAREAVEKNPLAMLRFDLEAVEDELAERGERAGAGKGPS